MKIGMGQCTEYEFKEFKVWEWNINTSETKIKYKLECSVLPSSISA